jgi:hypothetical protein
VKNDMSKSPRTLLPEVGNLAWAALSSIENVEMLDRFNGVPTLGTLRADGHSHLFWRSLFYVSDVSVWMYVPLTSRDLRRLDSDKDPLEGIIVQSAQDRYVAVACAYENRVIFEREWELPARRTVDQVLSAVLDFMSESLKIALDQDPIPSSRRHVIQLAADAVRELIPH